MSDQTPERDQPARQDRPVMGDHLDLEEVDERVIVEPADGGDNLSRLLLPGLIILVIALIVIGYFVFFN
jgi:hypothetical protein